MWKIRSWIVGSEKECEGKRDEKWKDSTGEVPVSRESLFPI